MFATRKVNQEYLTQHAAHRLYKQLESMGCLVQFINNIKIPLSKIQQDKYKYHQMSTLLRISFNFVESNEGFAFWSGISNRLQTIDTLKQKDNDE